VGLTLIGHVGHDRDRPRRVYADVGPAEQADGCAVHFEGESRTRRAGIHVHGHAHAKVPPSVTRLLLFGAQLTDIGEFEGASEGLSGAVHETRPFDSSCVGRGLQIAQPQLGRLDLQLARRNVDQPFDGEACFLAPGAADGIDRHGIRVDGGDAGIDGRYCIGSGQSSGKDDGRQCRRDEAGVRSEIRDRTQPQRADAEIRIERHRNVDLVVTPLAVRVERLAADTRPVHWLAELHRCETHGNVFGTQGEARSERAARVAGHDAHTVLGNAEHDREDRAVYVWRLRWRVK
jgi:hypothetical protein